MAVKMEEKYKEAKGGKLYHMPEPSSCLSKDSLSAEAPGQRSTRGGAAALPMSPD